VNWHEAIEEERIFDILAGTKTWQVFGHEKASEQTAIVGRVPPARISGSITS